MTDNKLQLNGNNWKNKEAIMLAPSELLRFFEDFEGLLGKLQATEVKLDLKWEEAMAERARAFQATSQVVDVTELNRRINRAHASLNGLRYLSVHGAKVLAEMKKVFETAAVTEEDPPTSEPASPGLELKMFRGGQARVTPIVTPRSTAVLGHPVGELVKLSGFEALSRGEKLIVLARVLYPGYTFLSGYFSQIVTPWFPTGTSRKSITQSVIYLGTRSTDPAFVRLHLSSGDQVKLGWTAGDWWYWLTPAWEKWADEKIAELLNVDAARVSGYFRAMEQGTWTCCQ